MTLLRKFDLEEEAGDAELAAGGQRKANIGGQGDAIDQNRLGSAFGVDFSAPTILKNRGSAELAKSSGDAHLKGLAFRADIHSIGAAFVL
jgi:hypothetical protein